MPSNLNVLFYILVTDLLLILFGYLIIRKRLAWIGWLLFVLTILLIGQVCVNENPVFRMLAIISSMFICMKIIAACESYKRHIFNLSFLQWIAFAIGWAGMRAQLFESLRGKQLPGAASMFWYGISRLCMGIIILLLAKQILLLDINKEVIFFAVTGLLLIGYSLILHFGILSMSAGVWRWLAVKTYLLFRSPLLSTSLSEFWSKRWNIAFSEMISIAIYRPLKKRVGPAGLIIISFIFSGLLHEMAISLPVGMGFGLPFVYFIIQGTMVLLEKILEDRNIIFLKNKFIAKVWVYFWVIIPAPLLFHIYFIKGIVWPVMGLKMP
ncbi:MAG TPA: membrane bound O-acyl transferase family-domain-containing protein [Chitinophagaceae bacterium]|nr:membrane bound O-acyl transferase family-domain-containing protein [Chitinophagaceae bacterium]